MYRELVFESAEQVFAEKGLREATMQEIAAEAGISLKTLYATYPGKGELYQAVQEERGREFLEAVAAAMAGAGDPLARLAAGVRAYVDFLASHRSFLRLHLRLGQAWALRPSGDGVQGWREGVAMFAELLREGMAQGSFVRGDCELLAMMGIAVMQVALARLANGPRAKPEAVAEEILLALRRLYGCAEPAPAAR
jgi:AcrR family transcriptional regulator